jgi:hypothetical protein
MKAKTVLSSIVAALLCTTVAHVASADFSDANCEVRKDGDKQQGKSGACTFSQRQGYIDLDLRNGDTYRLSPSGQANHYRDQSGHKVVRTYSGGNTQEFKWEGGKKVTVNLYGSSYGNGHNKSYGNGYNGNYNNGGYGAASYGAGSHSSEYQRGYSDGQRGTWDQDRHSQEYKDGFRAGEQSRGGGHSNSGKNSGDGEYYINRMQNGNFEVVWSTHGCVGTFTRNGEPLGYSNSCTNSQTERSSQIAKHQR